MIDIILELVNVTFVFNYLGHSRIIGEYTHNSVKDTFRDIVDQYQEPQRPQHCALWHS